MKSSPIYIKVDAGQRKARDFGAVGHCTLDVRVGTSGSNSHELGEIRIQGDAQTGFQLFYGEPGALDVHLIAKLDFQDGRPLTSRPRLAHIGPVDRIDDEDCVDLTEDPLDRFERENT